MYIYESYPVHDFSDGVGRVYMHEWINNILEIINEMETEDEILVYDFGKNGNCKICIYFDDDYDIKFETDIWVHPEDPDDGEVDFVDREYIARNDYEGLQNKLLHIWNEEFVGVD